MTTTPQIPSEQIKGSPSDPEPGPSRTAARPEQHEVPFHLRVFTYLFAIPLMTLSTAFFGCVAFVCATWDSSGRQQHFIARLWARSLILFSFSPVQVIGAEKLRNAPTAVYASNHLSYMDTPVLFACLPFQFRILAKGGLWKMPFVGWYLNRSGQVAIHSGSPRTLVAGLLLGVKALQSGMPLVVFPEGARTSTGELQSFASGCAFMAIRAGVPLVPLTLIGTYELLPMHTYALRPRPLKIVIGDPIPTTHLTTRDADALTAQLFAEITRLFQLHSAD